MQKAIKWALKIFFFLVLLEECKRFKSVCQCNTFRTCVVLSFSVCLNKLFRSDILVELLFKEHEWPLEPSCWCGLMRSQLWMWRSSSVQGFLHGGAFLQCKAPFQDASPLNLLLFHGMRLFSQAKGYALPNCPSSHHNKIPMQDDGRNLLSIKKIAKASLICYECSVFDYHKILTVLWLSGNSF